MKHEIGEIYMIRCIVNYKVYIGQTRCYYKHGLDSHGNVKYEKAGWRRRVNAHFYHIENNSPSACPKLKNAVIKHTRENFIATKIEQCHISDLDNREIWWIRIFNSCKYGYNISPGGRAPPHDDTAILTKQMRWFDDNYRTSRLEIRMQLKQSNLPSNVTLYLKDSIHVGFRVKITRKGYTFAKVIGDGYNISLDEKLKLIVQWRDKLMPILDSNKHLELADLRSLVKSWDESNFKYINGNSIQQNIIHDQLNPNTGLPHNIYLFKRGGKEVGYKVQFHKNGKEKVFMAAKFSMETKLKMALEYRNSMKDNK